MNYQHIYENLTRPNDRQKGDECFYEEHHILPKCLGGTDDRDNLVLLTTKEHFIAHRLLTKIYPSNHKLLYAVFYMGGTRHGVTNSRTYQLLREEYFKKHSEHMSGTTLSPETVEKRNTTRYNNGNYIVSDKTKKKISESLKGRILSEETKQKMRESSTGKNHDYETRRRMSESHKGKTLSEETELKIGEYNKTTRWLNNGEENIRTNDNDKIEELLSSGWVFGQKRRQECDRKET